MSLSSALSQPVARWENGRDTQSAAPRVQLVDGSAPDS